MIFCPSKGRAKRVLTSKLIPSLKLCVPENEVAEYRKHNPSQEIIPVPDEVQGIAATRNWMTKSLPPFLFMLDDDITALKRAYIGIRGEAKVTDEDTILQIIKNLTNSALECNCRLWGFGENPKPSAYDPMRPIRMAGYVSAHAIGVMADDKLKFRIDGQEGFWMSGLNAHYYRKAWIDTRFCFQRVHSHKDKSNQWGKLAGAFGKDVIRKQTQLYATDTKPYTMCIPL